MANQTAQTNLGYAQRIREGLSLGSSPARCLSFIDQQKRFLRMIFDKLCIWWRSLPQKKRVQLIASVLLVFAGTEVFVLAPYILDIAVMIDVGGLVVVIAAFRSSVSVSMMQLRALLSAVFKPILVVFRFGETISDFGSHIAPNWYRRYYLVDRIVTRSSAALLVLVVGVVLAKTLAGIV